MYSLKTKQSTTNLLESIYENRQDEKCCNVRLKVSLKQIYEMMWSGEFIFPILGINFLAHDFDFKKATVVLALGVRHSIPTIAKEKIEDTE